jgi:multiple sugar transport system substrate-binding protein
MTEIANPRLTRRALVGLGASAAIGLLATACGTNTGAGNTPSAAAQTSATTSATTTTAATTAAVATSTTSTASRPATSTSATTTASATASPRAATTSATSGAAQTAATPRAVQPGQITIPSTGAALPTDQVTFRWMDSGDLKALFERPVFDAFHQAHGNISIHYDGVPWDTIKQTVPLGIQNGSAPDVFAIPPTIPTAQAVRDGWVTPLEEVIPNFKDWQAAFPFGSFIPGVHIFNDKTYTFSLTSNKRLTVMLFYMPDRLQEAGYDPASKPLTWDEFRAAAKKLTDQGKGQAYGLLFGGKSASYVNGVLDILPRVAGARGSSDGLDWKTGEYDYTSPQYQAAIELLVALKSDGSMLPGSLSLTGPDARARFSQGHAGMILDGPWDIPAWPKQDPSFTFAVSSPPLQNAGQSFPITYAPVGDNQNWVYAKSKYKAIAGDIFSYMGSVEGQAQMTILSQGNLVSLIPEANQRAEQARTMDPVAVKANQIADQLMRIGPIVSARNPDSVQVAFELKPIHPDIGEITQGVLSGQVSDVKHALQTLNDNLNKELDRAIKAAQGKGAKVSRNDWVYPNWDPAKDYTEADYKQLPK